jgi:xanthine dehydrogenase small subunit
MLRFVLNDSHVATEVPHGLPALDYLRRHARLTGVKYACREGDCGSCAVLLGRRQPDRVNYRAVTSCLLPLGAVDHHHVVTVEGLNGPALSPIQRAFVDRGASQCGFCTPGFVVTLTGHLLEATAWTARDMVEAVAGNICRCTGYTSILRAIDDLVEQLEQKVDPAEPRVAALVREGLLPDYFLRVGTMLGDLGPAVEPQLSDGSHLVVAGGTDLYVQRPLQVEDGPILVLREPQVPPIRRENDHVYLSAGATAEDMKGSRILADTVGGIDRAMELMGSWPIRARATVAGNLVNASPIGDMTIILLALDAELGTVLGSEHRVLPLARFFHGYKELDLRPGELVEWVRFSADRRVARFNFEKVSKRTHLDIASVNSAISVTMDGDRFVSVILSAGGVAPVPARLPRTEALLRGRTADAATAHAAAAVARTEVAPISDVRGSAAYKRLLLGQLVLAHFNVLFGLEDGLVEGAPA